MGEGWYVGKRGGATGGSDLTRGGHAGTVSGELGQSVPVKKKLFWASHFTFGGWFGWNQR